MPDRDEPLIDLRQLPESLRALFRPCECHAARDALRALQCIRDSISQPVGWVWRLDGIGMCRNGLSVHCPTCCDTGLRPTDSMTECLELLRRLLTHED